MELAHFNREEALKDILSQDNKKGEDDGRIVQIRLIVIGESKSGKSLFIYKLLGFRPGDLDAPKFGRTNVARTQIPITYKKTRRLPGLEITDCVGIANGGDAKKYATKYNINMYDAIILMTSGTFTSNEICLYKMIKDWGKPCFLVVSHFDVQIKDEITATQRTAVETETMLREQTSTEIKRLLGNSYNSAIELYLIDSNHPDQFDFQNLIRAMCRQIEGKRGEAITKLLFRLSPESIEEKTQIWKRHLFVGVLPSALAGLSPIPLTDTPIVIGNIIERIIRMRKDFYLTKKRLETLCSIYNLEPHDQVAEEIMGKLRYSKFDYKALKSSHKEWKSLVAAFLSFGIGSTALVAGIIGDGFKSIPLVGTPIGMTVDVIGDYICALLITRSVLTGFKQDSLIVIDEIKARLLRKAAAEQNLPEMPALVHIPLLPLEQPSMPKLIPKRDVESSLEYLLPEVPTPILSCKIELTPSESQSQLNANNGNINGTSNPGGRQNIRNAISNSPQGSTSNTTPVTYRVASPGEDAI